ncbi:MAG: hypothetical protein OHK0013_36400 [Sandaracinaceae bacterium]
MVRLRRVPVLVSTLALVAGCGSADRVEISGIVRDSRTHAPLAGARVTGADGAATHTDGAGRFTLAVVRGLRTQLRVSAEGHADSVQTLGVEDLVAPEILSFDLQPVEVVVEESDPDAVVRWQTAPWVWEVSRGDHAERSHDASRDGSRNADVALDLIASRGCPAGGPDGAPFEDDTEWDERDVEVSVGGAVAPWLGASAPCVECHQREGAAGPQADVLLGRIEALPGDPPHAHLADGCVACHRGGEDASTRCGRCHGDAVRVGSETGHREWNVALDPIALATEARYLAAIERARRAMLRRRDPRVEAWIEVLERDASRGAHDPRWANVLEARAH